MNFKEKMLYHQIHPLKLFIDWSMAVVALYSIVSRLHSHAFELPLP